MYVVRSFEQEFDSYKVTLRLDSRKSGPFNWQLNRPLAQLFRSFADAKLRNRNAIRQPSFSASAHNGVFQENSPVFQGADRCEELTIQIASHNYCTGGSDE
jgi:hypothetical protein